MGVTNFAQAGVYLERYVEKARHIEVQIFGDGKGNVRVLGERDCSAQRRNQKVIEETPAAGLSDAVRDRFWKTAETIARAVDYRSAGTVEFLYDAEREEFFFLEVNTRLQVEHGVTEEVTGVDIVEWMVKLGSGDLPPLEQLRCEPRGASIQVRIYAEDPARGFRPMSGLLTEVCLSCRRSVRDVGRKRNGSHAVLRSHAGKDHRPGQLKRRCRSRTAKGARVVQIRRTRNKSRISPSRRRAGRISGRRLSHQFSQPRELRACSV